MTHGVAIADTYRRQCTNGMIEMLDAIAREMKRRQAGQSGQDLRELW